MQFSWSISPPEKMNEVDFAPDIKLRAEVIFGVPSQGCRGTGICKLTTLLVEEQNKLASSCKKALVLISKTKKGRLRFQFEKASMCKKAIRKNFQYGHFLMEEDFEVPSFVQVKLNAFGKIISKGLYPVIEGKKAFTIVF